MLKAIIILSVLFNANRFQDKRMLLVFTDDDTNPLFMEQQNILKADASGLKERDIDVKFYYAARHKDVFEKKQIKGGFTVILVGKDGGDKLKSSKPITLKKLYATIDAMPMRQSEMKRRP